MRGDFAPPPVVGDVDEPPDECARGVASANGARRAVPAAKASGRYRFGEGTFPRKMRLQTKPIVCSVQGQLQQSV
jgi:hypothetical protein